MKKSHNCITKSNYLIIRKYKWPYCMILICSHKKKVYVFFLFYCIIFCYYLCLYLSTIFSKKIAGFKFCWSSFRFKPISSLIYITVTLNRQVIKMNKWILHLHCVLPTSLILVDTQSFQMRLEALVKIKKKKFSSHFKNIASQWPVENCWK